MGAREGQLAAVLDAGPGADPEELAELTQRLRGELLDLDVDAVEVPRGGAAPEGAKAAELLALGELIVSFAASAPILQSIVGVTSAWLGRQQARSVKLTLDGDTLELTGVSSEEQSRLTELWIARHADTG